MILHHPIVTLLPIPRLCLQHFLPCCNAYRFVATPRRSVPSLHRAWVSQKGPGTKRTRQTHAPTRRAPRAIRECLQTRQKLLTYLIETQKHGQRLRNPSDGWGMDTVIESTQNRLQNSRINQYTPKQATKTKLAPLAHT